MKRVTWVIKVPQIVDDAVSQAAKAQMLSKADIVRQLVLREFGEARKALEEAEHVQPAEGVSSTVVPV